MNKLIWFGFFIFLCWFVYSATLFQISLGLNALFIIYLGNIVIYAIKEKYINSNEGSSNDGPKE